MASNFDYSADQLFVVAPRNTGGSMLSFLLSLDNHSAALDFKLKSLEQKIEDWHKFYIHREQHAHLYGFMNFGHPNHVGAMAQADRCGRYIHKCHFYELDGMSDNRSNPLLDNITGSKLSVGIHMTESCVEKLQTIRPHTPKIDYYQLWVYSNQKSLLADFYGINCQHSMPFMDMLDKDCLIDHLKYCRDLLGLDADLDVYAPIISQWHEILKL